jgi:type IV pilus assembly protein PilV
MKELTKRKQTGFTLIECVIAIVLILIGLLAVYSLVVYSVNTQLRSGNLIKANSLARQKIEELKNLNKVAGGSLTTNTTNYFDTPSTEFIRRWQISDDPAGLKAITVTVVPSIPSTLQPQVSITTKMQ